MCWAWGCLVNTVPSDPHHRRRLVVAAIAAQAGPGGRIPSAGRHVRSCTLPARSLADAHIRQQRTGRRSGCLESRARSGAWRAWLLVAAGVGRAPRAESGRRSGLVHVAGEHQALAHDPARVAHLLHLAVQPQVRVAELERPVAERVDLLVEAVRRYARPPTSRSARRANSTTGRPCAWRRRRRTPLA
jgi:hypothetical protein